MQVAQQVGQVQQKAQAALQAVQDQVQDQLDSKYSLHIIHTPDHPHPASPGISDLEHPKSG